MEHSSVSNVRPTLQQSVQWIRFHIGLEMAISIALSGRLTELYRGMLYMHGAIGGRRAVEQYYLLALDHPAKKSCRINEIFASSIDLHLLRCDLLGRDLAYFYQPRQPPGLGFPSLQVEPQ